MVVLVVFYLSTMCVAKYNSILSCRSNRTDSTSVSESSDGVPNESPAHVPPGLSAVDVEASIVPSAISMQTDSQDTSEQIEASMELVGPFLCVLLLEHKAVLSKVLVGTDGRLLISDGKVGTCCVA